jgi:hypothetical protein
MRVPRRVIDKQLTCPACGDVVAGAVYRPVSGDVALTTMPTLARALRTTSGHWVPAR